MSFTIESKNKHTNKGAQNKQNVKTIIRKSDDTRHKKFPNPGKTFGKSNSAKDRLLQKSGKCWSSKGGKVMFPTDNEARKNEISNRDVAEKIRHNKESEKLTRRAQNFQLGGQLGSAGISALGRVGAGALKFNHPDWYLQDKSLADQTTNISTVIPIGLNQVVFEAHNQNLGDGSAVFIVYPYYPVVSCYNQVPTDDAAVAKDYVLGAPINYINKALYAYIKNKCRRNLYYTPADVIRTILAVIDAFVDLESIKRVYRIANTYKFLNRTLASSVIRGLGFDPTYVFNNLSEILFRVNRIGKLLSTIHIPKGQTIFDRWMFLNANIFKDRDSEKSRLFAFRKAISYRMVFGKSYENHDNHNVFNVALEAVTPDGQVNGTLTPLFSPLAILTYIEDRVTQLLNNTEILGAMADMLTAFESNGYYEYVPLAADERQEFIFEPNVIRQVRNGTICGLPCNNGSRPTTIDTSFFELFDLGDGVLAQGKFKTDFGRLYPIDFYTGMDMMNITGAGSTVTGEVRGNLCPRIGIDTQSDHPDAGDLLVASRFCTQLQTVVNVTTGSPTVWFANTVKSHGSELLAGVVMFYFSPNATEQNYFARAVSLPYATDMDSSDVEAFMRAQCFSALPRFGICPKLNIEGSVTGTHLIIRVVRQSTDFILGDMEHIIYITGDQLERWHFIALASELSLKDVME